MLSYQHAYHAGGPADVHKHAALALVLDRLTAKDRPLSYMETHAGRGVYDLAAPEAAKTGEAGAGIVPLLARGWPPSGHPYRKAIDAARARFGPSHYPGSPLIAVSLLRPQDHIHLMELHPAEHRALRRLGASNVHVHRRDGYEGVLAISPPTPRRGLVLIDPSYEIKTEYEAAARFIAALHRKWAEAVVMLWYPILAAGLHEGMCRMIAATNPPGFARREVRFAMPDTSDGRRGMAGSGLLFVNMPFGAEDALEQEGFRP